MTDLIRTSVARERLVGMLSGFFGVLALGLTAIGLWGATSYFVNCRRTEIAVRMALGASAMRTVRLVLRRMSWLVALGVLLGAVLSWWLSRFVEASMLFQLERRDPATFVLASGILIIVAAVAGWLPARRAARMDPTIVLRTS